MSQETAELYASHMMALASQARAAIRDLDPKVESTPYVYVHVCMSVYKNIPKTYIDTYIHIYVHIHTLHTHTMSKLLRTHSNYRIIFSIS